MEKLNYKSIIKNVALIFLILLILGYNVYTFLIAPKRANDQFITTVIEQYDSQAIFLNEFNVDGDYVVVLMDNQIVFLDHEGQAMYQFEKKGSNDVEYGVLNDRLIYILKENNKEIWIDANTSEVILEQDW